MGADFSSSGGILCSNKEPYMPLWHSSIKRPSWLHRYNVWGCCIFALITWSMSHVMTVQVRLKRICLLPVDFRERAPRGTSSCHHLNKITFGLTASQPSWRVPYSLSCRTTSRSPNTRCNHKSVPLIMGLMNGSKCVGVALSPLKVNPIDNFASTSPYATFYSACYPVKNPIA